MKQTESGNAVPRVLDKPQQRQHVLDVSGVEKLQSAKFYERDVPARQLDFKRTAVAGRPEQNGLLFKERTGLALLQDALDDKASLVGLVADGDELRLGSGRPLSPEVLGETLLGETDDAVGGGEDRLRRAIITVERDDVRGRRELVRKVEDVAHGRWRGTSRSIERRRRRP